MWRCGWVYPRIKLLIGNGLFLNHNCHVYLVISLLTPGKLPPSQKLVLDEGDSILSKNRRWHPRADSQPNDALNGGVVLPCNEALLARAPWNSRKTRTRRQYLTYSQRKIQGNDENSLLINVDSVGYRVWFCRLVQTHTCGRKSPECNHVLNPRTLRKGGYLDAASNLNTSTPWDATKTNNPLTTPIPFHLLDVIPSYCFCIPNHDLLMRRFELERATPSTLSNSSPR